MSIANYDQKNPFLLYEVHELCAICTKQLEEDKTCSLSSPINANTIINAYQVLETISEFKLQENGPNFACSVCFKNIASTYKFLQICNRAQELFSQFAQYQQEQEVLQEKHAFTTDVKEDIVPEEERIEIVIESCNDDDSFTTTHYNDQGNFNQSALDDLVKNAEHTGEYTTHKNGRRIQKKVCPLCKKKFSRGHLRLHLQTHAEFKHLQKPVKKIECEVCKVKICVQFLRAHMERHTGKRSFICATCGRGYINLATLRGHELLHDNPRPYVCPVCHKGFTCKSYLAVHNRIHTGEKEYECDKCGKVFTFLSALRTHERTHSSVRNFICKLCGKGCLTKAALESHMVFHTRERKHECAACGFKFAHLKHMRAHVQKSCTGEPKRASNDREN